jgi:hypothetical protein
MTSEAKIEANRRNASKSTGPKTERGRLNALRHGMTAKQLVASDEDFGDFARFSAELRATLAPADAVEEQMVEGIVVSTWRLRRAWRAEAALIKVQQRHANHWDKPKLAAVPLSHAVDELSQLARYEAMIERLLERAYAALDRRQARRLAEAASAETSKLQNEAKLP